MIIGEIVEILISIKDSQKAQSREEQALIEACNLLSRLPRLEEATTTDTVAVVRCGDCKKRRGDRWCNLNNMVCADDEYCSFGEKRVRETYYGSGFKVE